MLPSRFTPGGFIHCCWCAPCSLVLSPSTAELLGFRYEFLALFPRTLDLIRYRLENVRSKEILRPHPAPFLTPCLGTIYPLAPPLTGPVCSATELIVHNKQQSTGTLIFKIRMFLSAAATMNSPQMQESHTYPWTWLSVVLRRPPPLLINVA